MTGRLRRLGAPADGVSVGLTPERWALRG